MNNKTHGIAKYDDEDTFNYKEIQVTLDKSQQFLVGSILNFITQPIKSITIKPAFAGFLNYQIVTRFSGGKYI